MQHEAPGGDRRIGIEDSMVLPTQSRGLLCVHRNRGCCQSSPSSSLRPSTILCSFLPLRILVSQLPVTSVRPYLQIVPAWLFPE